MGVHGELTFSIRGLTYGDEEIFEAAAVMWETVYRFRCPPGHVEGCGCGMWTVTELLEKRGFVPHRVDQPPMAWWYHPNHWEPRGLVQVRADGWVFEWTSKRTGAVRRSVLVVRLPAEMGYMGDVPPYDPGKIERLKPGPVARTPIRDGSAGIGRQPKQERPRLVKDMYGRWRIRKDPKGGK